MFASQYRIDTDHYVIQENSNVKSDTAIDLIWVSWGDNHAIESIASAWMASTVNKDFNQGFRYYVYILGKNSSVSPEVISKSKTQYSVNIITNQYEAPTNPALYDVARMTIISNHNGPSIYMDSDVYCFAPFNTSVFTHRMQTFAVGYTRRGPIDQHHHGIIDEVTESDSSAYYSDIGLQKKDYRKDVAFWPYLRYNLGLFYTTNDDEFKSFVRDYEATHQIIGSNINYFGTGEMIFASLVNNGSIQDHYCDWSRGYGVMHPLGVENMHNVGIIEQDDKVIGIDHFPDYPILHVGHLSQHLFCNVDPNKRPIQLSIDYKGDLIIQFSYVPRKGHKRKTFVSL